jgi:hypothetical protein
MIAKTELSARKRRTRAEVQQLVAEFVSSGVRRSEFCQSRGLSFSTLDRHLKKRRWKRRRRRTSSAGRLVPVENPVATPIVAQADELFAVDADARRKTLNTAARHIRRQETADLFSMISAARSRQRSPRLCLPAHSARLANTRSGFGRSLPASWSIPN